MLGQIKSRILLSAGPTVEGRDGWFFLSDQYEAEISYATGLKRPTQNALQETARLVEQLSRTCRQRGQAFLFVPAPAKPGIYAEMLPEWVRPATQNSFLSQLAPRLDPALVLDLRPALVACKGEMAPFSRLNSHWSDAGALVAWRAIEERLSALGLPPGPPLTTNRIEIMDGFNEMAGLCGHEAANDWAYPHFAEDFPHIVFDLADGVESPQLGRRAVQLGDMPVQVRAPEAATPLSCLVISDSSATSLSPYFGRYFTRVRYVRHPLIGAADEAREAMSREPFDVVLLLNAERYCPRLGQASTLLPA